MGKVDIDLEIVIFKLAHVVIVMMMKTRGDTPHCSSSKEISGKSTLKNLALGYIQLVYKECHALFIKGKVIRNWPPHSKPSKV